MLLARNEYTDLDALKEEGEDHEIIRVECIQNGDCRVRRRRGRRRHDLAQTRTAPFTIRAK